MVRDKEEKREKGDKEIDKDGAIEKERQLDNYERGRERK